MSGRLGSKKCKYAEFADEATAADSCVLVNGPHYTFGDEAAASLVAEDQPAVYRLGQKGFGSGLALAVARATVDRRQERSLQHERLFEMSGSARTEAEEVTGCNTFC